MRLRLLILVLLAIAAGTWAFLGNPARNVAESMFISTGADSPMMMDFDPVSRHLFVLHDADNDADVKITRLSADDFTIVATYPIARFTVYFEYYQPEDKIYYLEGDEGRLYEYDCSTMQDVRWVDIGEFPQSFCISSTGQTIAVAYGEYPKYVTDMTIREEDDPDWLAKRRGHVAKIDRLSFVVQQTQETYSGPLFIEMDANETNIWLTNSVPYQEGGYYYHEEQDFYIDYGTDFTDVWTMVERFNLSDLSLLEEFQAGTSVLGDPDGNIAILGGNAIGTDVVRPTYLVNLNTGVKQEIDLSAYDYQSMSNSAVSSSLNKAFIMRVHETDAKGDMIVVDLTDLSSYQYHVADYGFNQIIVDEVGDQLILMNNQGLGLVSVSPIP